jgi:hypothetical protein
MVDVDEAVRIATTYLSKVMPGYVALQPKIEEFELSEDGAVWNITFRAKNPDAQNGMPNIFYPYVDKVVQIQTSNGDLIAIRNPSYN